MARVEGSGVSAVAVADQFGRTGKRLARAFDDALARHGVTMPRARALLEVAANGPMRLAAVAEAIGIAQGTASEMTDALVREGLLARREDPSDRRAVLLEATPPGLDRAERWRGAYEQAAADLFQPLSPGQRAELLQLLQALGL
jgi:DNA-binding MarR family transcriptional regulator